jgi:hypothetical protein
MWLWETGTMFFRYPAFPVIGRSLMRDGGAFALGFLVCGNMWMVAGLHSPNEGVPYLSYAIGLIFMWLGVFGVYRAYNR